MSEISGQYTTFNAQVTNYLGQFGIDLNSSDAVAKIQELCQKNPDVAVTLSKMAVEQVGELFGVPKLDEPETEDKETDLEKLIAELQMATDEKQIKRLKDEIKAKIGKIKKTYQDQIKKIEESIEKAKKAEKAGVFGKIFSWIGTALAVAAAVVACIATGGIAVGPVIGALMSVATLVMDQTGATEKLLKSLAESIAKTFNCSKETAQIWAQVIYMSAMVAVACTSIACSAKGIVINLGKAAAKSAELGAQAAATAARLTEIIAKTGKITALITTGISLAQIGTGVASTITGYKAGMAQVNNTDIQKILKLIQKRLEEDNEALQKIMDALTSDVQTLVDLLEVTNNTKKKISEEIGSSGIGGWA